MATNFKILVSRPFTDPLSVRQHNDLITSSIKNDGEIMSFITRAKGVVIGYLSKVYDESSLRVTPYVNSIQPDASNTGTGVLLGAQPQSTAYSEYWTITFSSATDFSVSGSLSMSQGTGTVGTKFTSTNGDLIIPADAFSGTPASGDKFYVSVSDTNIFVSSACSMIAASLVLGTVYNEQVPDENDYVNTLYDRAIDILDRLSRPEDPDGLSLSSATSLDIEPLPLDYRIDSEGNDVSTYYPDYPDRKGKHTLA